MPPTLRIVVESQLYLALMVHLINTNCFTRKMYYPLLVQTCQPEQENQIGNTAGVRHLGLLAVVVTTKRNHDTLQIPGHYCQGRRGTNLLSVLGHVRTRGCQAGKGLPEMPQDS